MEVILKNNEEKKVFVIDKEEDIKNLLKWVKHEVKEGLK